MFAIVWENSGERMSGERESPKIRRGIRGYMFHVNSDGLERN